MFKQNHSVALRLLFSFMFLILSLCMIGICEIYCDISSFYIFSAALAKQTAQKGLEISREWAKECIGPNVQLKEL